MSEGVYQIGESVLVQILASAIRHGWEQRDKYVVEGVKEPPDMDGAAALAHAEVMKAQLDQLMSARNRSGQAGGAKQSAPLLYAPDGVTPVA